MDLHCTTRDLSLWIAYSLVEACWLSCCGAWAPEHVGSYFLDQGSNLHPLNCKADSYPLTTSEVPSTLLKRKFKMSALENLVMCGASILFLLVLSKLLSQVGIKIAGRNVNNLGYADETILMAESKRN